MADFATEQGRKPGEFLFTNRLTNGQSAMLLEHAYITCAIAVMDELRQDVFKRLDNNEEPLPITDKLTVEWSPDTASEIAVNQQPKEQ